MEGDVTASFVVHEDGSTGKPSVGTSMGQVLKDEVLRVVELSSNMWQPGYKDGKPVTTLNFMVFRFIAKGSNQAAGTKERLAADVIITKNR
ncbi:energy transducer TonB [Pontibacter actiniarum]|uniref:energy transducer TonB n=1 Tax=Pontibacter actiniarum TaxID=323450 RepID=UPI001F40F040|nr:energy transducer TonB [Pontibacter actiniarum]